MAVWSKISTSGLVGAVRLDAEFWQPYYLEKEKTVRLSEHVNLGSLVSTFKKGIFYILAKEYAEKGVPFYRSSNVGAILPKEENITYIKEKKHRDEYKTALVSGDLMIVKTGKSGASVVLKDRCNVSQDVIAVKVNRDQINPYYLAVYLNTRFGLSEMNRWFQGQVQPHLSLEDARRILVPLIQGSEQQKIEELILSSVREEDKAKQALSTAQHNLESELGLDELCFQKPVGYTVQFSELEQSLRSDAEFFHTKYEPFLESVKRYRDGWAPLKQLTKRTLSNFNGKAQTAHYDYIEIRDIAVSDGAYSSTRILAKNLPANAKIMLVGGEIVISQVRPTRGAIAIIDDTISHPTICSGAFYVCKVIDPNNREAVWLYLRSIRAVFEKYCGGTSYPTIESNYITKFPVPIFQKKLAIRVRELVLKSKAAKKESQRLITLAKTRVEQLIEEAVRS